VRKRQVKKFAKNARKNFTPYREAYSYGGGSKKIDRRRRAFLRCAPAGAGARWDARRIAHMTGNWWRERVDSIGAQLAIVHALIEQVTS
jgi:hypothetical protein